VLVLLVMLDKASPYRSSGIIAQAKSGYSRRLPLILIVLCARWAHSANQLTVSMIVVMC
jgi:hypothetical protein